MVKNINFRYFLSSIGVGFVLTFFPKLSVNVDDSCYLENVNPSYLISNDSFSVDDFVISDDLEDSEVPVLEENEKIFLQSLTNVNLRKEANTDSFIVDVLEKGSKCVMLHPLDNGWYEVDYQGMICYVCGDYVKEVVPNSFTGFITLERDSELLDSTKENIIDVIPSFEVMKVEKEEDSYYLVNVNGKSGYLSKQGTVELTDTFVVVDVSDQSLSLYQMNEEILTSDVVTGKNSTPSTIGLFEIQYKAKDQILRGNGYASYVEYWMPYYNGEGLHDASWRDSFGGDIYENNGSHGCVNLPIPVAKEIYNHVDAGDKVLIKR